MSNKTAGPDTTKFKMKTQPGSPPGLELDGHGNAIPLAQRTAEDRRAAIAAGEKSDSIKNPEEEAQHPAPMPRQQQGQGGKRKDNDPAGRQGGQH